MVIMIGVGALIGVALGLRFNVFVLIPTIILAGVSTAVIQAARGDQASSIVVTIVLVATTLQIGYLVGIIAHAAFEKLVPLEGNDRLAPSFVISRHLKRLRAPKARPAPAARRRSTARERLTLRAMPARAQRR